MMKLSQVPIKRSKIFFDEGDKDYFEVRGINFTDLMTLMNDHAPAMRKIYDMFMTSRQEGQPFDVGEVRRLLMQTISEFPDLVLRAVAFAADDPAGYDNLRQLPLPVQADALEQAAVLSIRSEAELKKFQDAILRLIQGVTTVFKMMSMKTGTTSTNGYGKSAKA